MLNLTESEFITAIKNRGVLVSGYEPTERRHVSFDDTTVIQHGFILSVFREDIVNN
ncbi:hypothetical protein [Xenorhabdus bovienii]|uniref:Putative phage protein n=1 Tax=Xenorhabdus bovienii TaxID=40576 RepID=A0A0B6XGP6_XENBV|nr:hypothetical protein [Xenorhabdus bovienii]CDM92164.1 Putative phage protein [Xenorhabdus bovienii]